MSIYFIQMTRAAIEKAVPAGDDSDDQEVPYNNKIYCTKNAEIAVRDGHNKI